jgi:hypothetical protein
MVLAPREDSTPSLLSDPRNTDTEHLSRLQTEAFDFCITSVSGGLFHVHITKGLRPTLRQMLYSRYDNWSCLRGLGTGGCE